MHVAKNAVLVLFVACVGGSAQTNQSGASVTIPWSEMIWHAATIGGRNVPHAALMVSVRLDSLEVPAIMQLDTGANNDVVYTKTYTSLQPKETPGDQYWIGLSGTVAGRAFRGDWFAHAKDVGGPVQAGKVPLLGTIGAAFFERRILLLDFVAQRLAILGNGEDLTEAVARRIEFVPLEYRNGKMFVAMRVNGAEDRQMFYDTGSSSMALNTTRQRWLELTGRQPGDTHNSEIVGESWGKPARWIGAPLKGEMSIGKASVSRPLVFFESTGLDNFDFDKYPFKTSGLFGNLLFDGRFTVVVDLPHKRFGLYEGSLAEVAEK